MKQIKKGDKLKMQVIVNGVVLQEFVSYAYERNGILCVYSNDYVNTIEEMKGTTFTILDEIKDKEYIKDHTRFRGNNRNDYSYYFYYDKINWESQMWLDARRFDNNGIFTETLNECFERLKVPNYKSYLFCF